MYLCMKVFDTILSLVEKWLYELHIWSCIMLSSFLVSSCYKGIIGEYSLDELFSKNEGKIRDKRIVRNLKNAKYKFMHEIDDDVNEVAIRTKLAFQINI